MPSTEPPQPRSEIQRRSGDSTPDDRVRALEKELARKSALLEATVTRFRGIIDRNADAFVIVDEEGAIRYVNPAAVRLFRKDATNLIGAPFGHPLAVGETTEVDVPDHGTVRIAEMRVDRTEWEGVPAFIASLRDITERRRAEHVSRRLFEEQAARKAAEAATRRLEFLLDTTTLLTSSLDYREKPRLLAQLCVEQLADWAVVYITDADGQTRRLAVVHRDPGKAPLAEELCAIPIDPRGTHPILEVIRSRQPRIAKDVKAETLQRMSADPRELRLALEMGVASFMSVPIVARNRALGAIAFVAGTPDRAFDDADLSLATDVANRAALAFDNALLHQAAQIANQRKADFLAVVSHDLRTPLTAIIGYADLMQLGVPEPLPPSALERIERMRSAARHLLYLLNELLTFARLEADREPPRMQRVDLGEVISEVAGIVEPLAARKGLEIIVQQPGEAVRLATDPDKLRQILLNLLGNAVKYTPTGQIRLSVARTPVGATTIEVSDTGLGIAEEHLAKVFEPFWQVRKTDRAAGGGAGLGLSVVRHLVTALGGAISVQSRVGEGSTFIVTLPP